jgi:hypothetical protein
VGLGLGLGDRLFSLRVGGVTISAEIGVMATMATSDAQKKAYEKYAATDKGQEARRKALEKFFATEHGKETLKAAQERFEASEERKAYKREWFRQRRLRIKNEKLEAEKAN